MNIQRISNNQNYSNNLQKQTNFKAWRKVVLDPNKVHLVGDKPKHMNNTAFFRYGSMWEKFIKFITEKYKDTTKVNVYNYGCSDGSEPLSLAMILKSKYGEIAHKFLPIIAKDYDEVAIDKALSREYTVGHFEKGDINKFTNNEFSRYFTKEKRLDSTHELCLLKPELYEDVKFSIANILDDCKNIKKENSFVMARNFWPYLSDEDKVKLAFKLSRTLKKNCTLMIGEFDLENRWSTLNLSTLLKQAKFKPTDNPMFFEK